MTTRFSSPIGIFDSGVGGLTVFRELSLQLPQEDLIYFGDTARVPYGPRSPEVIVRYTLECAERLMEQNIKLLVIACHTASARALNILQEKLSIPVIGVVDCALELLMQTTQSHRVAILGTASTIASSAYQTRILNRAPTAQIFAIPCPLFVPLAEEGLAHHDLAALTARHYLEPLRNQNIDAALLACTHYPLLRTPIQQALGDHVTLIEAAACCAKQCKELLEQKNLLNLQTKPPIRRFYVSDDPEKFRRLAPLFLGCPADEIHISSCEK